MAAKFDWNKTCSYEHDQKEAFHRAAKRQLKTLAERLDFQPSSYDLRSNKGGIAGSGEITLHHNDIYIQASQFSPGKGLLIRTCENRKDFTGGQNHFAPLEWLDDENHPKLARLVKQVMEQKLGFNADLVEDKGYNPHLSTPRVSM